MSPRGFLPKPANPLRQRLTLEGIFILPAAVRLTRLLKACTVWPLLDLLEGSMIPVTEPHFWRILEVPETLVHSSSLW